MSDTSITLSELPASRRAGNNNYDWSTWLDGRPHLLLRGTHFEVTAESMRSMAFVQAKRVGVPITTRLLSAGTLNMKDQEGNIIHFHDDGLALQADRESW